MIKRFLLSMFFSLCFVCVGYTSTQRENDNISELINQIKSFKKFIGQKDNDKITQEELLFKLYKLYDKKNTRLFSLIENFGITIFFAVCVGSAVSLTLLLSQEGERLGNFYTPFAKYYKLSGLTAGSFIAYFLFMVGTAFEKVSIEKEEEELLRMLLEKA